MKDNEKNQTEIKKNDLMKQNRSPYEVAWKKKKEWAEINTNSKSYVKNWEIKWKIKIYKNKN